METLALTGLSNSTTIEVTPKFVQHRSEALADAAKIVQVTNGREQQLAISVLSDLKRLRTGVESTRKTIKEPVIELGKRIDKVAKDAVERITFEEGRVKALVEPFAAAQLRKEQEAEAARQRQLQEAEAEQRRVEQERLQAEEELRRATAQAGVKATKKAVQAIAAADAKVNSLDVAVEDAKQRREEVEGLEVPSGPIMVGAKARPVWDYEVIDVQLFAKSYPDLVTITPKRSEVLAFIQKHDLKESASLPGLRIFDKVKLNVR